MAQIIRHRKGVLESINGATKRKAELLIATGSSGITSTNSDAIVFVGTSGTEATAVNKIIYGTSTPNLSGASYGNQIDGVPYYNTSENKLYILGKDFTDGKLEVQASANTGGTGIISGSSQIAALGANIYSSSAQVASDLLSDNRNIDLGTGTFDAGTITSDGALTVTGVSNLGIISGSNMKLSGNANIDGNIVLGGNITIGDASSDTVSFGGEVASDIIPSANNTYDLGSSTDKFAEVHATSLFGALNSTNGVISGSSQLDGTTIGSTANASFIGTFTGTVNANNGVISGSSNTDSITITETDGNISAAVTIAGLKGGVVSGSAQVVDVMNANTVVSGSSQIDALGFLKVDGDSVLSGSAQIASDISGSFSAAHLNSKVTGIISGSGQLLNVATDFGTGRLSADDIGNADGSSTITGSFVGDGSGLTGLATDLNIAGGTGTDTVDLLNNTLTFSGTANEIVTAVTDNTVTFSLPDDVTIGNDLTVTGDLTVSGTTTTVNSTTVNIGDNIIELNGSGAALGGLYVGDVTSPGLSSGSLLWDGTNNYWIAGPSGSEEKVLLKNSDGVVSGSSQISADQTDGWVADVRTQLDSVGVVSGSAQISADQTDGWVADVRTQLDSVGVFSGSAQVNADDVTNFDANVLAYNNSLGVISGSSQVFSDVSGDISIASDGTAAIEAGVIVNADVNASAAIAHTKLDFNGSGIVSGSSQVTTEAAASEILIKHASNGSIDGASVYSLPATSTIAINDSTPTSAGASGELIINGTTSGFSGILTQDLGGSTVFQQYATSGDGLVNLIASSGYGFEFRADNTAGKSWQIDTDGDFVAQGNLDVYAYRGVFTNDISGSNLKLTGNAEIDGNIVLGGNITVGDAATDTITLTADLSSDIIPDANNTRDLGASGTAFAEIHGTNIYGTLNGTVYATNGVISGSTQLTNVATDFGTGRVSGDNFGDADGGSTFTGSFSGDGSGLTGLSTDLNIADGLGNSNAVDLINDTLTFDSGSGATGIEVTVSTDKVSVTGVNASTSAKGVASFDSDDFSVSSGNVSIAGGGVRAVNFNADVVGDGIELDGTNNDLNVLYGSSANTAVQGNTTATFTGTANEIEVSDSSAQALGGGIAVTIGLPNDVTIGNDLTVTTDASVGGNLSVTGNLSVLGTTTTIDSTTVSIGDNILELNIGGAQTTAGLQVTDATGGATVSGSLLWDGTNDYWKGGALGSEKEFARLDASPTSNRVLKADANGLLVDSTISDDGTDVSITGDLTIAGLSAGSDGAFLYVDSSDKLQKVDASTAGDVIQWNGSSFVASNELDGGTF